jgi:hypothetical protein
MKEKIIITILIITTILIVSIGSINSAERNNWLKAHCEKIGQMSGDIAVGVGMSSGGRPVTVVTPVSGKTGYKCDDGITYWE